MSDGGPPDRAADRPDLYESDDDLWRAFAGAVIRIRAGAPAGEIVLGIGKPVPPLPWQGPAYVITAWNPGRVATPVENEVANERLLDELRSTRCRIHPATGESPDGTWIEASFAVIGLARDEALRLGQRFGQLAIFEVEHADVTLLRCPLEK